MNIIRTILTGLVFTLSVVWAQAQSIRIWADSVTVKADSSTVSYLKINMLDDNELYSGFQMNIETPEGIKLALKNSEINDVFDVNLNRHRFKGLNHNLCVNMPSNSTVIKVGCVDITGNKDFYRGDLKQNVVSNLFDIGLIADNSLEDGVYVLKFSNCMMIRNDATYNKVEDFTSILTVTHDDIDAINENLKESNSRETMYDLSGAKVKEPLKGHVYIISGKKFLNK